MSKRFLSLIFILSVTILILAGYCHDFSCVFSDNHHHCDDKHDIKNNYACAWQYDNRDFFIYFKEEAQSIYLSRNIISEPQFEYV